MTRKFKTLARMGRSIYQGSRLGGVDISNGISPDDRYVKLGSGFDYADVAPVSGVRFAVERK